MFFQDQLKCSVLILSVVDYKLGLALYLVIFVIYLMQKRTISLLHIVLINILLIFSHCMHIFCKIVILYTMC